MVLVVFLRVFFIAFCNTQHDSPGFTAKRQVNENRGSCIPRFAVGSEQLMRAFTESLPLVADIKTCG